MHGKEIVACLGFLFLVSVVVILMEIDGSFVSKDRSGRQIIRKEIITDRPDGDGVFKIDSYAQLPNEGRKAGEIETCSNALLVALWLLRYCSSCFRGGLNRVCLCELVVFSFEAQGKSLSPEGMHVSEHLLCFDVIRGRD